MVADLQKELIAEQKIINFKILDTCQTFHNLLEKISLYIIINNFLQIHLLQK